MKPYLRDGRAPIPENPVTSLVMRRNKAKNTKPEMMLRKALWETGLRGYRLNWKNVPGRPDIAFPGRKIAIFVNGCFWHRCQLCNPNYPKSNLDFWDTKFARNIERDKNKNYQLRQLGWTVWTIWECEVKNNLTQVVNQIKENFRLLLLLKNE